MLLLAAVSGATSGDGSLTVGWSPPTSTRGSAITRDVLKRSPSPTNGWVILSTSIVATTLSFTVTGVCNGSRHYIRIAAGNATVIGASSANSAVPTVPPGCILCVLTPDPRRTAWPSPTAETVPDGNRIHLTRGKVGT